MSFYRSKRFWIAFIFICPALLLATLYGIKTMTSVYKKDLGNGVVIYADDYVKSGQWVFDCEYGRLISRQPVTPPITELQSASELTIESMYSLREPDLPAAKSMIRSATAIPGWYKNLRYLYSGIDEYGGIIIHGFDMLVEHEDRQWALIIWQQILSPSTSDFFVTAKLYDPENYLDHTKALEAARKSCPIPQ
ncbi:hypothetical protein [Pseudomonas sp. NPDC089406]|uniref:hypothetical protein n=1 Tax=Pseudomonas sp. NPDC089406 TaxID=3364463 RepID=UPI00384ED574